MLQVKASKAELIPPHGGKLVHLIPEGEEREELLELASTLKKVKVDGRHASHAEMIANGTYSPLEGFMTKEEALSVISEMRLPSGLIWSIPVLLPVSEAEFENVREGERISLETLEGTTIAVMRVEDRFTLDLERYSKEVFKTNSDEHPGVRKVKSYGNRFIGGKVLALLNRPQLARIPRSFVKDPSYMREEIKRKGWRAVAAFQTRNPIHRAHEYLIRCAMEVVDGLLLHPLIGDTKPDDVPPDVRLRCYQVLLDKYLNAQRIVFSLLAAPMHYAGPREAIHHMIMRKNYGATHMIIGRDHAGVGNYYGTYEAQELAEMYQDELGIRPLKFEHAFYCKLCKGMATTKTCNHSAEYRVFLSGTKLRQMLRNNEDIPEEVSRPEVVEVLRGYYSREA